MFLQRQALRRVAASRPCANCLRFYSSPTPNEDATTNPPKRIFSGIQPTGIPHLGNYLGALRQWVKLQNEAKASTTLLFSIVDLHAITVRQDASTLFQMRKQMLASLLAVGLDPSKSILFCQSAVLQHAELMWMLSCNASVGYLSRMTQWKSKLNLRPNASPFDAPPSSNSREALKLGLFSYPVLQAADILLYNTTHVPVGEDQSQHVEFTRELATGFNHAFGDLLVPPQTILSPAKRVMSLKQPHKKMSKSAVNEGSRILISDTQEVVEEKIKVAVTDSVQGDITYEPKMRPGVANLINIAFYMDESGMQQRGLASPEQLAQTMQHLAFQDWKPAIADIIGKSLAPIRERYMDIMERDRQEQYLGKVQKDGASRAKAIAEPNLRRIKNAMGMGSFDGDTGKK
ncbi:tryptophanyl-tRNA synthetase [Lophiostoma macrostomum CBS 122681]|uniref:tryptophan--tRNA ligase n=1 Tax=Lophiostoma macrostomum CBS 122681 TaxID=1314788 RepID=A0A6A6SWR8_9PLEO|nr:tryptophanyl-tRNA synthetase [Lophiostoma macrostomum CBS 122681]